MAKTPPSKGDDSLDGMSAEVDRLLKQLPNADPKLRGSGPLASPVSNRPFISTPGGAAVSAQGGWKEPSTRDKLGVWLRAGLGVTVGVLMTQWPYRHACGLMLYLYLTAVTAVIVTGGWAGVSSWKRRMGVAHAVSLSVVLWGLVLAAAQVLPRIGYAAAQATWRCL